MRRAILLSITVLITAVLLAGVIGTAAAEPGKNQIEAPATCKIDGKDVTYTFVINGMSKTGHITAGGTGNIVVKEGTVTYFDPNTGEKIGSQDIGHGNENGLQGDLISCTG